MEYFIRAVTKPFNGAFSLLDGEKLIICRSSIFETDLVDYGYRDRMFGEIVEIFSKEKFLIECRGGLLIVNEYESKSKMEMGKVSNS